MPKRRRSVSLDPEVADQIDDLDHAFSPLVNKWARDYLEHGRRPAMDRHRVERLITQLDQRQEAFNQAVAEVNAMFDAQREALEQALGEADGDDLDVHFEELYNRLTDRGEYVDNSTPRDPENPAIENHARKLGVSPERLVYELEQRDVRDGFADEIETHPSEISEVEQ